MYLFRSNSGKSSVQRRLAVVEDLSCPRSLFSLVLALSSPYTFQGDAKEPPIRYRFGVSSLIKFLRDKQGWVRERVYLQP